MPEKEIASSFDAGLRKWGNSIGIVIPPATLKKHKLKPGNIITVALITKKVGVK